MRAGDPYGRTSAAPAVAAPASPGFPWAGIEQPAQQLSQSDVCHTAEQERPACGGRSAPSVRSKTRQVQRPSGPPKRKPAKAVKPVPLRQFCPTHPHPEAHGGAGGGN
jgi:hypothetical protein